jgi:hypothetical protein
MPVYMIGYDLHQTHGTAYDGLYAALEELGSGYWDCLEATWLVITDKSAGDIVARLTPHVLQGDRLLVLRCGDGCAWHGFDGDCKTWLQDHLQGASGGDPAALVRGAPRGRPRETPA